MPVNRFYSNVAVITQLTAGVNNAVTTISVASTTGFPVSFPYTIVVDEGTPSEELMEVTAASGLNLTVVRGVDGSTAASHASSASVKHSVSARDFREPQEHIAATAAHGATGAVVGTTNTQTLTNKNLADTSNVFGPAQTIPSGAVIPYAGGSAPTGWLLCDGAAVSRTTYAALFAAIGTAFGTGDGSTTFNVPDLRGRVPLGAGQGAGLTLRTRGQTGGSENSVVVAHSHSHAHSASSGTESADHTHTVNAHSHGGATGGQTADHSHALGISDAGGVGGGGSLVRKGGVPGDQSGGASNDHAHGIPAEAPGTSGRSAAHTHAITVNSDATSSGVSGTGANMIPFAVLQYIIKT